MEKHLKKLGYRRGGFDTVYVSALMLGLDGKICTVNALLNWLNQSFIFFKQKLKM